MKIELEIKNIENIGGWTQEKERIVKEIVGALITSGGLTGVKGGKTIIHFDANGTFQGIELDYWPWRRKKEI